MQVKKNRALFVHTGFQTDLSITAMLRKVCDRIDLELLDVSIFEPDYATKIIDLIDNDLDSILCVISLNGSAFYHLKGPGECLHDVLKLPVVIFFVDHPAQFVDMVPENIENALVLLIDPDFEIFWHKYYPGKTRTHICNLMPFSDYQLAEPPTYKQYLQRTRKIFAPLQMSYKNLSAVQWWDYLDQLPPPMDEIAKKAVMAMIDHTDLGIDQFIEVAIEEEGAELSLNDRCALSVYVEGLAKMWRRQIIVSSVIDFPIVISSGYIPEDFKGKYDHKFIDTSGDATSRLYDKFQLVLNVSPAIPNLIQDRVISSVNAASTLISETNLGISQYFTPDKDFVDIPFDKEIVREKVGNILEDPQKAYDIAVSAFTSLQNNETTIDHWKDIFRTALEMRQA